MGKTTTLKTIREAAEKRGYIVEGFAPTSRAAHQLRDAGISADTLQGFLARPRQPKPERHLYMVDESSLASTKQVRDFLPSSIRRPRFAHRGYPPASGRRGR